MSPHRDSSFCGPVNPVGRWGERQHCRLPPLGCAQSRVGDLEWAQRERERVRGREAGEVLSPLTIQAEASCSQPSRGSGGMRGSGPGYPREGRRDLVGQEGAHGGKQGQGAGLSSLACPRLLALLHSLDTEQVAAFLEGPARAPPSGSQTWPRFMGRCSLPGQLGGHFRHARAWMPPASQRTENTVCLPLPQPPPPC